MTSFVGLGTALGDVPGITPFIVDQSPLGTPSVLGVRGPLLELGDAVVRRWFADPVNPMMMGNS